MKKIYTLIVLLLIFFTGFAQTYSYRWENEYYAKSNAQGIKSVLDGNGNIYTLGSANNGTNEDIIIIKTNKWGKKKWEKIYNNGLDDTPVDIVWDSPSLYILGNTKTSASVTKVLLAKYDSNGVSQWSNVIGGIAGIVASALDVYNGNSCFTGYQPTSTLGNNLYVAKYNTLGVMQWTDGWDKDSMDDGGQSISISSNGDVYVGGYGIAHPNQSYKSGVLLKYNAGGTLQWTKEFYQTNTRNYVRAVKATGISTAVSIYVVREKEIITNYSKCITQKYNSSGTLQWMDSISYSSVVSIYPSLLIKNNSVYVSGYTKPSNDGDGIVHKYSTLGVFQWSVNPGSRSITKPQIFNNNPFPVDDSGNVYIRNNENSFAKYNSSGTLISSVNISDFGTEINSLIIDDINNGLILTGKGSNADSAKYPVRVYNSCMPKSTITVSIPDTILCTNGTLQIYGSGAKSYHWLWGSIYTPGYYKFIDSLVQNPVIKGLKAIGNDPPKWSISVKVEGIDNYACLIPSVKEYKFLIANAPTATNLWADDKGGLDSANICTKIYLNADGSSNYFYKIKPSMADSLINPIYSSGIYAYTPGSYFAKSIISSYPKCFIYTDTLKIYRRPFYDNPIIGKDTMVCNLSSGYTLRAYAKNSIFYTWSTGVSGSTAANISVNTPGQYSVLVEYVGKCSINDTITVYNMKKPNIGRDTTITNAASILLDGGKGYDDYSWPYGGRNRTRLYNGADFGIATYEIIVQVDGINGTCYLYDTLNLTIVPYVSTNDLSISQKEHVFPNPSADGNFILKLNKAIPDAMLQVTDLTGRVIEKKKITGNLKDIHFNIPESGLYILTLYTDKLLIYKNTIQVKK